MQDFLERPNFNAVVDRPCVEHFLPNYIYIHIYIYIYIELLGVECVRAAVACAIKRLLSTYYLLVILIFYCIFYTIYKFLILYSTLVRNFLNATEDQ